MVEENEVTADHPSPVKRFRLHLVSAAIAVLSCAGYVLAGYARGRRAGANMSFEIGQGIGHCLGALLVAFVLGWISYRIASRSNLVGNLVFVLVFFVTNCAGTGSWRGLPSEGEQEAPNLRVSRRWWPTVAAEPTFLLALDQIRTAHTAVDGSLRGRRYATQQINAGYVLLLASQSRDSAGTCTQRRSIDLQRRFPTPFLERSFGTSFRAIGTWTGATPTQPLWEATLAGSG